MVCFAGCLFLAQITYAGASDEVLPVASGAMQDSIAETPQVEMEKCFALSDARPKECAADPDSEECKASEAKGKDGTEFKYVPRGTCIKQGGSLWMTQRPESQD
jgi:uncharacterized membrane protein